MILEYINAAMERARYEIIEDDEPFYGEVPGVQGVWASGRTLEECRRRLAAALEDWLLFSISRGAPIPPIGETRIELPRLAV
jgi:predicted RNase H-like HicB family nuclease